MLKFRHTAIAAALLSVSLGSTALTLGRIRGAALISQPLDISVEVRLDPTDDPAAPCFDGELFYGDSRVDSSRVTFTVERAANGVDGFVRVRSTALVDEPVLSLYLRAGCLQRSTRRYVVLAEMASEPSASQAGVGRPLSPGAIPGPGMSSMGGMPSGGSGATGATLPALPAEPRRRVPRRPQAEEGAVPNATTQASRAARPTSQPATPRGSRLKVDMLDLAAEREPTLRASSELLTAPVENAQRRAEAAAMWRAINAQPAEVLRDAQRVVTLENDVRSLRDAVGKEQARMGALRGQLDTAESQRYLNWLVYLLGALLLAATAAAVYFWRRGQRQVALSQDWWRGGAGSEEPELASEPRRGPVMPAAASPAVDIDLDGDVSMLETVKGAQSPTGPRSEQFDFVPSVAGSSRNVNAEELFDIQQQADFFVSLGQYDQAIEVLKNHISDNVETSALAYLDLLKIYHTLGRRDEYESLRQDFNAVFNAQVPVFESFSDTGSGLEGYPNAMARIEALWPSQKVLEIIEESLFRKPGTEGEAFDLEAYRELLLLYAMAKDVVERGGSSMDFELSSSPGDADAEPASFAATQVMQAYAAREEPTIPVGLPLLPGESGEPAPSSGMGLEFDLGQPAPQLPPSTEAEEMEFTVDDGDGELDPDPTMPGDVTPAATPAPADDGALMEFDLFDPDVEKEIAPKKPPR